MPDAATDRARARTLLLTNLLVLPGLGTFLGGRKASGALQMALALAGFGLTMVWFVAWAVAWIRRGEIPDEGLGPLGAAGLTGLGLFVLSWTCSLVSGLALVRRAPRSSG